MNISKPLALITSILVVGCAPQSLVSPNPGSSTPGDNLQNNQVNPSPSPAPDLLKDGVTVSTLAGNRGFVYEPGKIGDIDDVGQGYVDGQGDSARFNGPRGIVVDASGNVYVADTNNNRIRKITPTGLVTTFAGSGVKGYADGQGTSAMFKEPCGVALDASGNLYVADRLNCRIRKITPDGMVSTFAGSGDFAYADGQGTSAKFNGPLSVAVDAFGNVYVADALNYRIRKITPTGMVSTFAGSGDYDFQNMQGADGPAAGAKFNDPNFVAADAFGNVYVAEWGGHRIRKVTPTGIVSTFAGSSDFAFADGQGIKASFKNPTSVALDSLGNLFVADYSDRIRKITPTGMVSTFAGSGENGFADGRGASAKFNYPQCVALDASGNVYVAESNLIRKITVSN